MPRPKFGLTTHKDLSAAMAMLAINELKIPEFCGVRRLHEPSLLSKRMRPESVIHQRRLLSIASIRLILFVGSSEFSLLNTCHTVSEICTAMPAQLTVSPYDCWNVVQMRSALSRAICT